MKRKITVLGFLIALAVCESGLFAAEDKILVAYFSYSGNTRKVMEQIHQRVGGDIFEIKTAVPYPANYNAVVAQAEKERDSNARPALAARVENMDSYNIIFLGYPNWWYTIPMPIATFLESYNLQGKTIIPFTTHGGGGLSNSIREITKLCPNATILEAIAISERRVNNSQTDIDKWLRKIGMMNS